MDDKPDPSVANRDLSLLYPDIVVRFNRLKTTMAEHYKPIFLVEGFRSFERQKWLCEKKVKVTNALPGQSYHQFGLAIDIAFLSSSPFSDANPWLGLRNMALGVGFEVISRLDTNNGVRGDLGHLQMRYGMTMLEIRKLYDYGSISAVWARVDQIRNVPQGSEWEPLSTNFPANVK